MTERPPGSDRPSPERAVCGSRIRPYAPGDDVFARILPIRRLEFTAPATRADQPDLADADGFYRRGAGEFWAAVESGDGRETGKERIAGSVGPIDVGGGLGAVRTMFVAADRFYEKNGFTVAAADDLPASFPRTAVDARFHRKKL